MSIYREIPSVFLEFERICENGVVCFLEFPLSVYTTSHITSVYSNLGHFSFRFIFISFINSLQPTQDFFRFLSTLLDRFRFR